MWWNDESGVSRRVLDDTILTKWIDYVVNENKVISSHLGGGRAVTSRNREENSAWQLTEKLFQKFLLPHCHEVHTIVNFKDEQDSDASFRLLRTSLEL